MLKSLAVIATQNLDAGRRSQKPPPRARKDQFKSHKISVLEAERRLLARDLHDEVGQLITCMRFSLTGLMGQHCPASAPDCERSLHECYGLLDRMADAVRSIAKGLRPAVLDDLGLLAAIAWQAQEFEKRFGLAVALDVDDVADKYSEPGRTAIFRIVQEALTNCARHARAESVRIRMTPARGCMVIVVEDDGSGLARATRGQGFGLIGMKQRAEELGGTLALKSVPGNGTVVTVRVPLPRV